MRLRVPCALWAAVSIMAVSLLASCSKTPDPAPPPAAAPPVAAPVPVAAPPADTTPPASTPPAPAKAPQKPADAPVRPSATKADVVVTDMASPYPVNATVGQTIGIVSPGGDSIWQVDFPPDELTLLTPTDKLSSPGTLGWVWRAAKAGDIEIVLTARAPCPNPPCGENPARYPVTVHIKSRQ